MEINELITYCQKILSEQYSNSSSLKFKEIVADYSEYLIIRCISDTNENKESIIIKHSKVNNKNIYSEIIGLEFLNKISLVKNVIPKLYISDKENELVIIEDLDSNCKENEYSDNFLAKILTKKNNYSNALEALNEFHKSIAKIHYSTLGKFDIYSEIKNKFPLNVKTRHNVHFINDYLLNIYDIFDLLEIKFNNKVKEEINNVFKIINNPDKFLGFTHGDFTSANAIYKEKQMKIFDFETSDFRHIFIDGTFPRMRYIQSVFAKNIPFNIQIELENTYRKELIHLGFKDIENDNIYNLNYSACCFAWFAARLSYTKNVLNEDQKWGYITVRERTINALQNIICVLEEKNSFKNTLDICKRIFDKLINLWKIENDNIPIYEAFEK